jgi:hypothetical protein
MTSSVKAERAAITSSPSSYLMLNPNEACAAASDERDIIAMSVERDFWGSHEFAGKADAARAVESAPRTPTIAMAI